MKITSKHVKAKVSQVDQSMYGEQNIESSIAALYHESSKFDKFTFRKQSESIQRFFSPYITQRAMQPYKCYTGSKRVDLSIYKDLPMPDVNFFDVLNGRASVRGYQSGYKLSDFELFTLMHYSYGVSRWVEAADTGKQMGWRYVPSPGALYPLELYIVLFDSHMEPGIYHFRPDITALELIKPGNFREGLLETVYALPYIDLHNASGLIVTTGLMERLSIKYGERAYRFMLHESGFVSMMQSLLAHTLDLGTCMVGGYLDDRINDMLGVDGVFESVQNILILGKGKVEQS